MGCIVSVDNVPPSAFPVMPSATTTTTTTTAASNNNKKSAKLKIQRPQQLQLLPPPPPPSTSSGPTQCITSQQSTLMLTTTTEGIHHNHHSSSLPQHLSSPPVRVATPLMEEDLLSPYTLPAFQAPYHLVMPRREGGATKGGVGGGGGSLGAANNSNQNRNAPNEGRGTDGASPLPAIPQSPSQQNPPSLYSDMSPPHSALCGPQGTDDIYSSFSAAPMQMGGGGGVVGGAGSPNSSCGRPRGAKRLSLAEVESPPPTTLTLATIRRVSYDDGGYPNNNNNYPSSSSRGSGGGAQFHNAICPSKTLSSSVRRPSGPATVASTTTTTNTTTTASAAQGKQRASGVVGRGGGGGGGGTMLLAPRRATLHDFHQLRAIEGPDSTVSIETPLVLGVGGGGGGTTSGGAAPRTPTPIPSSVSASGLLENSSNTNFIPQFPSTDSDKAMTTDSSGVITAHVIVRPHPVRGGGGASSPSCSFPTVEVPEHQGGASFQERDETGAIHNNNNNPQRQQAVRGGSMTTGVTSDNSSGATGAALLGPSDEERSKLNVPSPSRSPSPISRLRAAVL